MIKNRLTDFYPGIAMSVIVGCLGIALDHALRAMGLHIGLDAMILAMLVGAVLKSSGMALGSCEAGIRFVARRPLEVAIALLGVGLEPAALHAIDFKLICLVVLGVAGSITCGYLFGRLFGLSAKMAMLVACGNSICGNSAIMAVSPVIGADSKEAGSAITFTAALSIVVIGLMPAMGALAKLDPRHYGIFAGMMVYAVPQVLAATAFMGALSGQIGAVVKLIRVLTLGPVLLVLGELFAKPAPGQRSFRHIAPWYVIAFFGFAALRAYGLLPTGFIQASGFASSALPVFAMAALGLSVDFRALVNSGGRILLAGAGSVLALMAIASAVLVFGAQA